jgi:hypothetical protein
VKSKVLNLDLQEAISKLTAVSYPKRTGNGGKIRVLQIESIKSLTGIFKVSRQKYKKDEFDTFYN